jgi:hypothetical protein
VRTLVCRASPFHESFELGMQMEIRRKRSNSVQNPMNHIAAHRRGRQIRRHAVHWNRIQLVQLILFLHLLGVIVNLIELLLLLFLPARDFVRRDYAGLCFWILAYISGCV